MVLIGIPATYKAGHTAANFTQEPAAPNSDGAFLFQLFDHSYDFIIPRHPPVASRYWVSAPALLLFDSWGYVFRFRIKQAICHQFAGDWFARFSYVHLIALRTMCSHI